MDDKKSKLRFWTYFRRGHSVYLGYILSFSNFIVLQYRLLVEQMPILDAIFNSILLFGIVFIFVYIPISTIIGYYDYEKYAVPIDASIFAKSNPYSIAIASAVYYLAEGENRKAMDVLKEWM